MLEGYLSSKTRVCVTVGMMTTGYDCEDILNLCLMRPIFSPTDFIQIKGRGTRRYTFLHKIKEGSHMEEYRDEKGTFKLFDFFATCEYFEEKFNYDEVLELPPTGTGTGDGDGGVINIDEYETIQPDPLSSYVESRVGLDGMKIDRKFYDHFEETVKNDDTVREHYESGNIRAAEEYIRVNLFDKPEEFFNLEKLRKSVQLDRRLWLWEIIEKAFGGIDRFKSKEELLDEELDKFVSIHRPDAFHISRIRDFFKAYVTDNEIRDIIENKEYNRLATNPKVTIADLKDLEKWRDVIPEYVKDYVKRIDSARDILVGKVPDPKSQVEQITIAMIYKFMDDMDNQTEELGGKATFFTGKFKQYAWSRLLDRKFSGHERLLLYAEGIEKMNINENIPQLFRDIFKGAFLPYRDPETLNLFLKEINGFAYDHSERLGDAFEYLLSVLSSQGAAGQFRTPRHIIDFIVEIVDPAKEDTVLDPACGTAGFLISSYKHILRQNTKNRPGDLLTTDDKGRLMTNFCGYDISPDMVRLSLVNMYLHSFANPSIYEYDTLANEDRWDERYDVILTNPPFMSPKGGIRPHSRFTIKAKRSEVLFVDYIAEHLNVHGKAGVIVPEGIIFQSQNAYKNLRRMLIDEGYLYAVISMPAGVFQPYSGVKTSILLMDKTLAKKAGEILFIKVSNDGFDLGAQRMPIDKNDLPQALEIVKAWKQAISEGNGFELNEDEKTIACIVSKKKIAESGLT
jgi:type I restriction-modification system DNA methylase subunit